MTKEQEIVRSVFDTYIRDTKANSTKGDRPTFDMLEEVKNKAIKALEQPTHGTCKDCKNCEDIGVKGTFYCKRYGINHLENYYCADLEKRGNESGL